MTTKYFHTGKPRRATAAAFLGLSMLCAPAFASESDKDVTMTPDTVLLKRGEIVVTYQDFRAAVAGIPDDRKVAVLNDPKTIAKVLDQLSRIKLLALQAKQAELAEDDLLAARIELERKRILANAMLDKVARTAPPADISQLAREYYRLHGDEFMQGETVSVCHVLIATQSRTDAEARALAEKVLAKAQAGAAFETLVNEYSEDPAAKRNSGCYQDIQYGQMVEAFEEAAFAMDTPGELAGPVKTQYGYHVIQFEGRTPKHKMSFAEVKDDLMKRMRDDYLSKVRQRYINSLLENNPVEADPKVISALRALYRPDALQAAEPLENTPDARE